MRAGGSDSQTDFSLGPPVVPFSPLFLGRGSPIKIDYRKKGTLIRTSLVEELVSKSHVTEASFLKLMLFLLSRFEVVGVKSMLFLMSWHTT